LNLTLGSSQQRTTILHAELPGHTATVVFEGEEPTAEIAEWKIPNAREEDSLEEIWRINPQDLQCKRKADGDLIKLGSGTLMPLPTNLTCWEYGEF